MGEGVSVSEFISKPRSDVQFYSIISFVTPLSVGSLCKYAIGDLRERKNRLMVFVIFSLLILFNHFIF